MKGYWVGGELPRPSGRSSSRTGFRPTEYNRDESDPNAMIYALKSFPMNVFIDGDSMDTLVKVVMAARDEVIAAGWL